MSTDGVAAFRPSPGWEWTASVSRASRAISATSTKTLPDGYRATRDFQDFVENLQAVARGEKTADEAQKSMPQLRRVGGVCPCSKSVRWVAEEAIELPASAVGA